MKLTGAGMKRTAFSLVALASIAPLAAIPPLQRPTESPQAVFERAIDDFLSGRVAESVAGFDRVAVLAPNAAPQLWQRGIALYYVGRYDDCRKQFESHRTVNPNDVENPAWHFLCVAHAESPAQARAALLPVGPDQRSPMREVYQMFRGSLSPEAVLAAGGQDTSARFYAELYVGLYYEATGDIARAITHLKTAASERFAGTAGYMYRVATLHPLLQRSTPKP
jgi:lipoprotein NlpI